MILTALERFENEEILFSLIGVTSFLEIIIFNEYKLNV